MSEKSYRRVYSSKESSLLSDEQFRARLGGFIIGSLFLGGVAIGYIFGTRHVTDRVIKSYRDGFKAGGAHVGNSIAKTLNDYKVCMPERLREDILADKIPFLKLED